MPCRLSLCVVSRQCPLCSSWFSSRTGTLRHLKGAFKNNRCFADRSLFDLRKEAERSEEQVECKLCNFSCSHLKELQSHIAQMHVHAGGQGIVTHKIIFSDGSNVTEEEGTIGDTGGSHSAAGQQAPRDEGQCGHRSQHDSRGESGGDQHGHFRQQASSSSGRR